MEVPIGFLAKLWSFLSFLPFFFLLLMLGLLKGSLIAPLAVGIILFGNSAAIIGLWSAHFIWTYYCVAESKRFGLVLKMLPLISLPLPLLLWMDVGHSGTGFHRLLFSLLLLSYMDALREKVPPNEKPFDIKLSKLPSCFLMILVGVPVNVVLITIVALWRSPSLLLKGWKRLLEDLIGREGPFLETLCVLFPGIAIILWPIVVVVGVISAIISSLFLGLYAGVISSIRKTPFGWDLHTLFQWFHYLKNM